MNGRVRLDDLKISGPRRIFFEVIYRRARQFRLFREQISSIYTYTYGLFRVYFLALGRKMFANGLVDLPEDVFFLTRPELQDVVQGIPKDYCELIRQRKEEIEHCRDVVLPTVIYGDEPPPLEPATGERFTGTPTSRGYYTGPARIVQGISDFNKVCEGDVLVVPFSDVSWTPLFARAGAVVAEFGRDAFAFLDHRSGVQYPCGCIGHWSYPCKRWRPSNGRWISRERYCSPGQSRSNLKNNTVADNVVVCIDVR